MRIPLSNFTLDFIIIYNKELYGYLQSNTIK